MRRVLVFCGSSPGARPDYTAAGVELGRLLAERGLGLVYGGASVGVMAAVADGALEGGGEVIGVIPRMLLEREIAHTGITDLRIVETMHERKELMARLSDAVIALPGGTGTMDELFEMFTWSQLGLHGKPIGLLNVADYWDGLLSFLQHMVDERFLWAEHRDTLLVEHDPALLLDRCEEYRPRARDKWVDVDVGRGGVDAGGVDAGGVDSGGVGTGGVGTGGVGTGGVDTDAGGVDVDAGG